MTNFTEQDQEQLNTLISQAGYNQIDDLAKVLDAMLPKHIHYILLSFGTLIMIKPDLMEEFKNFEDWDLPEHRFKDEAAAKEISTDNQKYLELFLRCPNYSETEKKYFQTALKFLHRIGYAYPGGERSDRNVMSLPLNDIPNAPEMNHKLLYAVTWPATPGIFNHLFAFNEVENFGDGHASSIGGDLFRYDYLQPRFHSIRLGQDNNESD